MKESVNRRQFVSCACACGALAVSATTGLAEDSSKTANAASTTPGLVGPVNGEQVMAVLASVDSSGDPALVDAVFSRWGYQCFHTRPGLVAFAKRQHENLAGYLEYVNSGRARYWERLDLDEARGILKVTGRKGDRCACPYAQCERPPRALCTHCCKAFQRELFRCVTGRDVEVQIDEAILLGGERCSTTIRLLPG
jgi:hypothetical protein